MENETSLSELLLSGLSDLPSLQLPLFLLFLLIYLLTLMWNLLIISLIVTDSHLHTPMYFFLGNLAGLDLSMSSVIVPQMLFDLRKRRFISIRACVAQIFFFFLFASSEIFLLAVMSYDRYAAICHPLHYMQMMCWRLCLQLVVAVWSLSASYASVFTLSASKLTFCASNVVESFFCDLPQLLKISCGDVSDNILINFIMGSVIGGGTLIMTFIPYLFIFKTVLKIPVNKSKVFSTCSAHLTVVSLFYGSGLFNYFHTSPNVQFSLDKVSSLIYTIIIPLFNPVIYSLRNQDFRKAFRDVSVKMFSITKQNNQIFKGKAVRVLHLILQWGGGHRSFALHTPATSW
ncbi:olfactory receptor 5B12-like [Gastrophryne carolinensis]